MVVILPIEIISEIFNNLPTRLLCIYFVVSRKVNCEIKKIIGQRFNKVFSESDKRLLVSTLDAYCTKGFRYHKFIRN